MVIHLALLSLTYLAPLFTLGNFSDTHLRIVSLLASWNRWDTSLYIKIATGGYTPVLMAFFPSFPLLERGLAVVVRDPFVAGLIVSNLAEFGLFLVLYRLIEEDFDSEHAWRCVLYLAVFPTAFFLSAAYTESLFLLCAVASFRWMRRGNWWLAGLAAIFAGLTRSLGICLIIPFAWEYARQHHWRWTQIRWDILAGLGIFVGVGVMVVYGALQFHDPLAFSHAEQAWKRTLTWPWTIFVEATTIITSLPVLMFRSIHTVIDLGAALFVLALLILAFVGPWKLPREQWSYGLYSIAVYFAIIMVPQGGNFPLASISRYMLEVLLVFLMLARMGKNRNANLLYLGLALPLLTLLTLQWLTGGWIV